VIIGEKNAMKTYNAHEFVNRVVAAGTPSMRYDGSMPFEVWREKDLEQLKALLRMPENNCDPDFMVESVTEHDTYVDHRFSFQTEDKAGCQACAP